ncbi:MAG TPA: IS110 family transposase [Burkholderiales bacterium]|nr:IS110 family transposase [Burkholderiales bacterium]
MRYIGVDLHKTKIAACYLTEGKYTHKNFKIDEIDKFKATLKFEDELCFEATTNSAWFNRQCASLVKRIVVVDTVRFKVISSSHNKTDKNDAKTLAFHLSKDMLPETKVKEMMFQDLQSLFNTRKLLVKQRTMLKNELYGFLLSHGIIIKATDLRSIIGLKRVSAIAINTTADTNIATMISLIKSINEQIKTLDAKLKECSKSLSGFNNLNSIDGLGCNTIIMLLATIGNIANFNSYKQLCSYLGLVPIVRNSNETIKHSGISKKGNATLRGNLIECAMVAITKNHKLNKFYEKLRATKGHGKAIVATTRKLVQLIYFTLKYSWFFEDELTPNRLTSKIRENNNDIQKDNSEIKTKKVFSNQIRKTLEINWLADAI